MPGEVNCPGCNKVIPPNKLDYGGAYYSLEGDSYCSKRCYDRYQRRLAGMITEDEQICFRRFISESEDQEKDE